MLSTSEASGDAAGKPRYLREMETYKAMDCSSDKGPRPLVK
jgi:hypothetical protein